MELNLLYESGMQFCPHRTYLLGQTGPITAHPEISILRLGGDGRLSAAGIKAQERKKKPPTFTARQMKSEPGIDVCGTVLGPVLDMGAGEFGTRSSHVKKRVGGHLIGHVLTPIPPHLEAPTYSSTYSYVRTGSTRWTTRRPTYRPMRLV